MRRGRQGTGFFVGQFPAAIDRRQVADAVKRRLLIGPTVVNVAGDRPAARQTVKKVSAAAQRERPRSFQAIGNTAMASAPFRRSTPMNG